MKVRVDVPVINAKEGKTVGLEFDFASDELLIEVPPMWRTPRVRLSDLVSAVDGLNRQAEADRA